MEPSIRFMLEYGDRESLGARSFRVGLHGCPAPSRGGERKLFVKTTGNGFAVSAVDSVPHPQRGRGSRVRRCGISAAIVALGLCRAAFADEPAPVEGGSSRDSQESTLSRLIEDLGSPVWRTRETATLALMQRGPGIYDTMLAAYRQASQHEVRRRIKRVIADVYVAQLLGPAPAFLGISHERVDPTWQTDHRVPAGGPALLINDVFPWTAADRAGVRRGDVVRSEVKVYS